MQLNRYFLALSICIALMGLTEVLYISELWCKTADFADSQTRPATTIGLYTQPPGPIYLENDSYYWLSYAQRIARGEDWRIRHTNMDGFPTGREVHWSQVVSWSMVVFGKVRAAFTPETLFTAVERASVVINPILFAVAATGLFVALARRFGTLPSALFTAFLSSLGDVGWTFHALRPGHQGFHMVFGAVSVVGLAFGGMGLTALPGSASEPWQPFRSVKPVDPRTARKWFLLAGMATGLALWVSATIESFFIYPMMSAFIFLLVLVPPEKLAKENLSVQPHLWRWWGLTAGSTGFLFYLLEYFPHHMAMRIEVNHPVYDLGAVGCGEALRTLTLLRWGGRRASPRLILLAALSLAVAALPILFISVGPITWHHMRDPQMLRLHNFIQEFYTYNNFVQTNRLRHLFNLYGILPLVSLLAPLLLFRCGLNVSQVTWLSCTFVLACSFGVVSYFQIRWLGFYAAAVCLSALVSAHTAYDILPGGHWLRRRMTTVLMVIILLVQPAEFYRRQIVNLRNDLQGLTIEGELLAPILHKRLAYALKASPDCPKAVIADPGIVPSLGYFAGVPCLTSFYWENLDGLHDATRFFAAKDPAEAFAIAQRTGATHVIVTPDFELSNYFYYIAYGHYDTSDANNTLAAKFLTGATPWWIHHDAALSLLTARTYSYRGAMLNTHYETFRIREGVRAADRAK